MKKTTSPQAGERTHETSYRLELPNGYAPQLNIYIRQIMRGQDLEAWKADPAKLNEWLRKCVAGYMQQVSVVLVTR